MKFVPAPAAAVSVSDIGAREAAWREPGFSQGRDGTGLVSLTSF